MDQLSPDPKYFTISDYLSSSIEKLHIVLFGVTVGAIFLFWGINRASRKPTALIEYERSKPDYFNLLIYSVIALATILGFINGGMTLHNAVSADIFFIGLLVAPRICRTFFKNYRVSLFVFILLFSFSSRLYQQIYSDIYEIKNQIVDETACRQIEFDQQVSNNINLCNVLIIGGTSNYVFLLDKKIETTYAVQRSHIKMFRYPHNPDKLNGMERLPETLRSIGKYVKALLP